MADQDRTAAASELLAAEGEAPSGAPRHRHRFLVGALFTLATIVGIAAVLAVWVNRQALNTDNWTKTSSRILADKDVKAALSGYLVTELFDSADVHAALQQKLPAQAKALAGPAAAGLEQLAGQAAPRLLATPQVQDQWAIANRSAHAELIKIVDGGSNVATTNGGVVTLNVHELVSQLAARLGIQDQVAVARSKRRGSVGRQGRNIAQQKLGITLPPSSGQIEIMRSGQLKTAQDVAGATKGLAILLPALMFALFIAAVALSTGRRRVSLRTAGWCFVGIALISLLARRVVGNHIVDTLVKNPSNKTAIHDVWNIATSLLYNIGIAMLVYGLLIVAAAAIGGPTRAASALRKALAPSLRERPAAVYGFVGFVYLLVLAWGPTPAFRQAVPVLGVAALLVLGVEVLRRATAAEFPEAQAGDTTNAIQSWYAARGRTRAAASPNGGHVADLERLAALHNSGALTDAEYQSEKTVLMRNGT